MPLHFHNKSHGHDVISILPLKICGKSILKHLEIIFKSCLKNGHFLHDWKKVNVVSAHKKSNKQVLRKYRPVSLLPICREISKRLIFNNMFGFFIQKQSGIILSVRF